MVIFQVSHNMSNKPFNHKNDEIIEKDFTIDFIFDFINDLYFIRFMIITIEFLIT